MSADQNFIIFRAEKLKQGRGGGTLFQAWRHLEQHSKTANISRPELTKLNRSQVLPSIEKKGITKFKNEIIEKHNKNARRKLRRDASIACEMLFSFSPSLMPDPNNPDMIYLDKYEKKLLEFIKAEFPDLKILRFDRHMDEKSIHYHLIGTCIDKDGKINIAKALGGKAEFHKHQENAGKFFAELGLSRGVPKKLTKKYHKSVREYTREQILREAEQARHEVLGNDFEFER